MSNYLVLKHTSAALKDILWREIELIPSMKGFFQSPQAIAFISPREARENDSLKLSLWLYQVTENEFLKNQPPARLNNSNPLQEVKPPLALNLYYLMTPNKSNAEKELEILGFVMRVLYDNPTVYINAPQDGVFEELRLILCRLNLEELTRIWEALQEPYRLSVCYKVTVVRVDSAAVSQKARVVEANNDYGEVPELVEG
jgi:hypothetical protein